MRFSILTSTLERFGTDNAPTRVKKIDGEQFEKWNARGILPFWTLEFFHFAWNDRVREDHERVPVQSKRRFPVSCNEYEMYCAHWVYKSLFPENVQTPAEEHAVLEVIRKQQRNIVLNRVIVVRNSII